MAKKKQSPVNVLFKTPLSLKTTGALLMLASAVLYINVVSFSQQQTEVVSTYTMTQSDLQSVLGTAISIGDVMNSPSDTNEPVTTYWREILQEKPNYRDGYHVLAVHSFNKRNCQDTRFYLDQAFTLDPNNKPLQELLPQVQSCFTGK